MDQTKAFRSFQLKYMGFVAVLIGPVVLVATTLIHSLPLPKTISETATIANRVGSILPFCLGALALFSLSYSVIYAYDKTDKTYLLGMFVGFTIVALQPCRSPYIVDSRVGFLGVAQEASHIIHMIGAFIGFGCMILWILLSFRKSNREKNTQTREKIMRNRCYLWFSVAMSLSLVIYILDSTGLFGENFPVMFIFECILLTFGGFACLVKGGLFFKDKIK